MRFNPLGTLALRAEAPDVYKLILQLSKMMRYSMNTSDEFVPISQEIAHARSYLELQRHRFDDKLTYEISGDPDVQQALVPRMIIQPIVEDVFKHAFDPSGGIVHVSIFTGWQEGSITIEIADNGPGMSEQRIAAVRSTLNTDMSLAGEHSSDHIGLANVSARLRLHCGADSRIELDSGTEPLGGLKVILFIPDHGSVQRGDNEDNESVDR